jgi:tetratricopeptide (TPR) repeat protein
MNTIITIVRKGIKEKGRTLIFLALSLFLVEETVRLGISSVLYAEGDMDSMEIGLVLNPNDAELNYSLARLYHIFTFDEKRAEGLYVKSLELSPLLSSSWLGIAEMLVEDSAADEAHGRSQNGEKEKARAVLRRLSELTPNSIAYLWEGSMLALRLGDTTTAMEDLRTVATADPRRRNRVFDMCWKVIGDPEPILQNVVSDEVLPSYLTYLISTDKLTETYAVWNRMREKEIDNEDIELRYVDFLLRRRDVETATVVWNKLFPGAKNDSLVWNGSFEDKLIGRGFDWRIRKVEGVKIDFDAAKKTDGERSLRLEFSGENNVNFSHVSQIIPVEPGSDYILTSNISTEDITTRNGIGWEVFCHGMREKSETVTGTVDWTDNDLTFTTPQDCRFINLRLRRFKSNKLDKYISGTAWVDNVNLFKLGSKASPGTAKSPGGSRGRDLFLKDGDWKTKGLDFGIRKKEEAQNL